MVTVPEKVLNNRWDEAPEKIKEAVFSPFYNDIFDSIGTLFHLSENKLDILRQLIFFTFFGFIQIQDLYNEIKDSLGIDPRLALDIYHEIDKKIF